MKYGNNQPNQTGGNRFPLFSKKARIFPIHPAPDSFIGGVKVKSEFKTYDKTHYHFDSEINAFRRMTAKPMSKKNRNRIRRDLEPLARKDGSL